MSLYSATGTRPSASPVVPANAQGTGKVVTGVQAAPASGMVAAPLRKVEPVGPQDDIVRLSKQGLQARGADLAASTADTAQNFMNRIARNLFGDLAATAAVSYKLSSSTSGGAAPAIYAGDSEGTPGRAALDLSRSASFIGKGQIATADGQTFDFEIAVKYRPRAHEKETRSLTEMPKLEMPDVLVLTGKPLPAIEFPGSLNDLFKLLSRELRTQVSSGPGSSEPGGDLTLRLQRLVDRAALLAPRARPDDPEAAPADRARAVADTYGSAPAAAGATRA